MLKEFDLFEVNRLTLQGVEVIGLIMEVPLVYYHQGMKHTGCHSCSMIREEAVTSTIRNHIVY